MTPHPERRDVCVPTRAAGAVWSSGAVEWSCATREAEQ